MKLWGFSVFNDDNKPKIPVIHSDERKMFCPEQISAMVLEEMKNTAEALLGETVTDAVITVPAYFNDAQRRATNDAGVIAGLNVIGMINEPTAAAVAYGLDRESDNERNVLIFDLGGGTFDVTIVNIEGRKFHVKATGGDTYLGGEDFDNNLVEHFVSEFKKKHGEDIRENKRALNRLRVACEAAKINQLNLFHVIDDVVLVGGSTRIPKFREMLEKYFDHMKPKKTINPDEAVAYGAAAYAFSLSSNKDPTASTNKEKHPIFEGERTLTKDNHFLGEFTISGIPPAPRKEGIVRVALEIDANGILHVSAVEKITGNSGKITISRDKGRLSEKEIKSMVEEAERLRQKDQELKQRSKARNALEDHAYSLKKGMDQKYRTKQQRESIMSKVTEILQWLDINKNKLPVMSELEAKKMELERLVK
uniref:heat shock 70 kDa protein 1-like n=1 Tax=Styela clava TaxID=7725 RepID=UPI00193A5F4F|nr:heat shock 70 kDa protein 1-like [Styela clava]